MKTHSIFLFGRYRFQRVQIGSKIAEHTNTLFIARANKLIVQMHALHERFPACLIGFNAVLHGVEPVRPTKKKAVWIDGEGQQMIDQSAELMQKNTLPFGLQFVKLLLL